MPMIEPAHETAVWLLDYLPLIGSAAVARIREKVERLRGVRIANVNPARNGGGVAELLSQLMRLFNNAGIANSWPVIQGPAAFFRFAKEIHNRLHGAAITLTEGKTKLYERGAADNASCLDLERRDIVTGGTWPCVLHIEAVRRIGKLDRRLVREAFERRFTAAQMVSGYLKCCQALAA